MSTLLQTRKASILAAVDAMPPSINPDRKRLDFITRRFLELPLFAAAVDHGWSDRELFAVDPARCARRPDRAGLVAGIALSKLNSPKLLRIERDRAIVECGTKQHRSQLTHMRTPVTHLGCLWWESPELCGQPSQNTGAGDRSMTGGSVMHTANEPCGKTCLECRQDRPITMFPHSTFSPDGRIDRCMPCISAAAQQGRLLREQRRPSAAKQATKSPSRRRASKPSAGSTTMHASRQHPAVGGHAQ